jgi:hypothetical protein
MVIFLPNLSVRYEVRYEVGHRVPYVRYEELVDHCGPDFQGSLRWKLCSLGLIFEKERREEPQVTNLEKPNE